MAQQRCSFSVYGFTIEVHAGGRRVWPPSFKRFVKMQLDAGQLTVEQVKKDCNVSQSLVYKWRSDVGRAAQVQTPTSEREPFFSEIILDEPAGTKRAPEINLRGREIELALPSNYPIEDLIRVILVLEGRS